MDTKAEALPQKKKLTIVDATLIVAGSMIGSGVFIVAADMGRMVGGPGMMMVLWLITGIMTIFAALSYGELAGMYPRAGGQYIYLKEAYSPLVGFLYGWSLFAVIQTGTIAAVAVAFAKYTGQIFPIFSESNVLFAVGSFKLTAAQLLGIFSILVLTFVNAQGINYGKIILRAFTSTKLIALFGLIILGLLVFRKPEIWEGNLSRFWEIGSYGTNKETGAMTFTALSTFGLITAMGVGLVGSLFSSDAWNNVTFIAGDVENPKRSIPLSLFYGTTIVIGLYLLVNFAYLNLLPFHGDPTATEVMGKGIIYAQNDRVATGAVSQMFSGNAVTIMAVLIMISTFGCNNGIILSGARVYQAMAKDGLFFNKMTANNSKGVPGVALWIQFGWASLLCLSGKYGELLDYVMFAVMLFYILTILGIFILRRKNPDAERPYKAFGYPVIPAIYLLMAAAFCAILLYMKPEYSVPGLAIVLVGIPIYFLWKRKSGTVS